MKVLVADRGDEADDFAWSVPGEVVYLGFVCARDQAEQGGNGGCGCGRSFTGMVSHKATTRARVVDMPALDLDELTELVRSSLTEAGWTVDDDLAAGVAGDIAETAEEWPEGTLLRRSIDDVDPA